MLKPFTANIPQSAIDDLHRRLDDTRWPPPTPDVGWERGVPAEYLRDLVAYWRHEFDWRQVEDRLNSYPQYRVTIDGATIHFLHVRSPEPNAVPMLMTTGWPASIVEYLELIGPLTNPRAHGAPGAGAFDLVIPTLPGFGFSTPLTEHGWTVPRTAQVWGKLMDELGYDHYIAHGEDWGSFVSLVLAAMRPANVRGAHVNFLVTPPTDASSIEGLSDQDLDKLLPYMDAAPGYMAQHATKPQTLSYGLTDSPVGQLAWYLEKFHAWSGANQVPEEVFDRDALLANVSLYWLTATSGNAAHYYCDNAPFTRTSATPHPEIVDADARFNDFATFVAPLPPVQVPVGVALYPDDIMMPIRRYAEEAFTQIIHWDEKSHGGHFPGFEAPDVVLDDLRAFLVALQNHTITREERAA